MTLLWVKWEILVDSYKFQQEMHFPEGTLPVAKGTTAGKQPNRCGGVITLKESLDVKGYTWTCALSYRYCNHMKIVLFDCCLFFLFLVFFPLQFWIYTSGWHITQYQYWWVYLWFSHLVIPSWSILIRLWYLMSVTRWENLCIFKPLFGSMPSWFILGWFYTSIKILAWYMGHEWHPKIFGKICSTENTWNSHFICISDWKQMLKAILQSCLFTSLHTLLQNQLHTSLPNAWSLGPMKSGVFIKQNKQHSWKCTYLLSLISCRPLVNLVLLNRWTFSWSIWFETCRHRLTSCNACTM